MRPPQNSLENYDPLAYKAALIILYLIYLRIPQQESNPDRGGLLR